MSSRSTSSIGAVAALGMGSRRVTVLRFKTVLRTHLGCGLVSLCTAIIGAPAVARAQSAAEAESPAAPADVVMLKNGGMLRGTISELVPGERVVIVLITGEVRTIEMDQVAFAGPAKDAPASTAAKEERTRVSELERALVEGRFEEEQDQQLPARDAPRARPPTPASSGTVHFTSSEPGLHVHLLVGSGEARFSLGWERVSVEAYRSLCTTPCSMQLEPGTYRFGISKDGGDPVAAGEYISVEGGETVDVEHQSYSGLRVGGWLTLIGGTVVGVVLMYTGFDTDCDIEDENCERINMTPVLAGLGIAGVSTLAGWLMILKRDEASVSVGVSGASLLGRGFRVANRPGHPHVVSDALSALIPALSISGTF